MINEIKGIKIFKGIKRIKIIKVTKVIKGIKNGLKNLGIEWINKIKGLKGWKGLKLKLLKGFLSQIQVYIILGISGSMGRVCVKASPWITVFLKIPLQISLSGYMSGLLINRVGHRVDFY